MENNLDKFNSSLASALGVDRHRIVAIVFDRVVGRRRRLNVGTRCVVSINEDTQLLAGVHVRIAEQNAQFLPKLVTTFEEATGESFDNAFAPVILASITHTASEALEQNSAGGG